MGDGRGWTAGGGLYVTSVRVAMSVRSVNHKLNMPRGLRDVSLTLELISDPCLPSGALHVPHCCSRHFTWPAKLVLEKQTIQLSLAIPL